MQAQRLKGSKAQRNALLATLSLCAFEPLSLYNAA